MSKNQGVELVWVEEFGGGGFVQYPVPPPRPVPETVRAVLQSVLYGRTYQGQPSTRHGRGIWVSFRGNRQGY